MENRLFVRLAASAATALLIVAAVSAQTPAPAQVSGASGMATQRAVLDKYCVGCHNTRVKSGGLALDALDLSHLPDHADIAEKVALKLRAGLMPPPRVARP